MNSSLKNSIVRNALISSAGKYGEYALALISSAIIARALGKVDYGTYAYIIWLCGWMIKLSNISLPTTVIRFIAESRGANQPEEGQKLAHKLAGRQSITTLIVCLAFLIAAHFYRPAAFADQTNGILLFICIAVFFKARYIYRIAIAKGNERFDLEAISSILVGAIGVTLVALLAFYESSIADFLIVYTLTSFLLSLALWILFKVNKIQTRRGSIDANFLVKANDFRRTTFLLGLVTVFGNRAIEMLLLGQYGTPEEVAFFTIAGALTRGVKDLLTVGLTAVLMSSMANAMGRSRLDHLQKIFLESTRFYLFCGVGIGFSSLLLAKPMIGFVYGNDFLDGAWVMSFTLCFSGIAVTASAVGAYLSTTDNQKLKVRFALCTLSVNLILAILLVPSYGLAGALISTGLTRVFSTVLGLQWVVRDLDTPIPISQYLRTITAGLLAIVIVYAFTFNTQNLLILFFAAIIYGILYVILTIALNCWSESDYKIIQSIQNKLPKAIHPSYQRLVIIIAFITRKKLPDQ